MPPPEPLFIVWETDLGYRICLCRWYASSPPLRFEIHLHPDVNGFVPCTNQDEINNFINTIVPLFESDPNIYAYAYSDGIGLGNVWPLTGQNGELRLVDCFCQIDN